MGSTEAFSPFPFLPLLTSLSPLRGKEREREEEERAQGERAVEEEKSSRPGKTG